MSNLSICSIDLKEISSICTESPALGSEPYRGTSAWMKFRWQQTPNTQHLILSTWAHLRRIPHLERFPGDPSSATRSCSLPPRLHPPGSARLAGTSSAQLLAASERRGARRSLQTVQTQTKRHVLKCRQSSRNSFYWRIHVIKIEQRDWNGEQMGGCSSVAQELCEHAGLCPPPLSAFFFLLVWFSFDASG